MKKHRLFFDFEKEEAWLREMALQGFRFTSRTLFAGYRFEKIEPQALNIRIDYRNFMFNAKYMEYLQLFTDSGWKVIYGSGWGYKYFVSTREDATEDIFSDHAGKVGRYLHMCVASAVIFLAYFAFLVLPGYGDYPAMWASSFNVLVQGMGARGVLVFCLLALPDLAILCFALYCGVRAILAGRQLKRERSGRLEG